MTADATPGGRPQYAAPRDEIAPPLASAGAARHAKTGLLSEQLSQAPAQNLRFATTAIKDRASRRHPTRREVPLGTRKLELVLQSPLASAGATQHAQATAKNRLKTCDSQQPRSKIARVAATPRGASYSAELVALSAAGDSLVTKNHFKPLPSPPNGHCPRASEIFSNACFAFEKISHFRRGARVPLGTRTGLCLT